jgi:hypothetical protein
VIGERGGIGRRARFRSWSPIGGGGSTPLARICIRPNVWLKTGGKVGFRGE